MRRIIKENDTLREIIDGAIKQNITGLVDASRRLYKLINSDDEAVALRAIDLCYKVAGVTATHTPNTVVQNVYVDNRHVLTPEASNRLREYARFKIAAVLDGQAGEDEK